MRHSHIRRHASNGLPLLACLALPPLAAAQDAQLKLPSFADLKDKAIKSVDSRSAQRL